MVMDEQRIWDKLDAIEQKVTSLEMQWERADAVLKALRVLVLLGAPLGAFVMWFKDHVK